ncbi:MAG: PAS domain-containing protein [Kiloniellaceae bacterium]
MSEPDTARKASPVTQPDFIGDADLRRLFAYWRSKRNGRPMPAKEDIDPIEISWALTRIFLMDYSPEDGFRYRLAGSEISTVFGRANLKGLTFADILPPEGAAIVAERWNAMVAGPSVVCMKGLVYLAAERTPIGERLLLPLADTAGGPVTGVLGMTICEWVSGISPTDVKQSPLKVLPVGNIP